MTRKGSKIGSGRHLSRLILVLLLLSELNDEVAAAADDDDAFNCSAALTPLAPPTSLASRTNTLAGLVSFNKFRSSPFMRTRFSELCGILRLSWVLKLGRWPGSGGTCADCGVGVGVGVVVGVGEWMVSETATGAEREARARLKASVSE